ncbi:MAG TPA: transcriptional regulator [Terricaulis sp.]|nr:transcriptional regulator [Terricaulis sp.]
MSRMFIPAREAFDEWRKNPKFGPAYDTLEEEFALAEALIKARVEADLTQEQVAERVGEMLTAYDPAEDLASDEAIAIFMEEAIKTADADYIAHARGVVARAKGMKEKA